MRVMDDREFFGAAGSQPSLSSGMRPNGRPAPRSLDAVTDPELRDIMEIVLDEDADLISYLANRLG
jgi:hypothetical protein